MLVDILKYIFILQIKFKSFTKFFTFSAQKDTEASTPPAEKTPKETKPEQPVKKGA